MIIYTTLSSVGSNGFLKVILGKYLFIPFPFSEYRSLLGGYPESTLSNATLLNAQPQTKILIRNLYRENNFIVLRTHSYNKKVVPGFFTFKMRANKAICGCKVSPQKL